MKGRELIRKLKRAGAEITKARGKGGHYVARYKGRQTTVPFHGDADVGKVFIKKLCNQLGIDPDEIL